MLDTIAARRLKNLLLSTSGAARITDVVTALGAVQAQDYACATWALGLRVPGTTETNVDRAFDEGRLLRTHVMRPTWHFVAPATIRWLLALTAPRVHASSASQYRDLEISAATRRRSQAVLARALGGGQHLTRTELGAALDRARIKTDARRLAYLMMAAELDAVVCSGPRRGKQFTYALLEERVPPVRTLALDRALAELTRRFFATHGPATARDFAWWAGFTVAAARTAIEMLGSSLASETIGSCTYWRATNGDSPRQASGVVHLLPAFDEYIVAYRDREAVPYQWPPRSLGAGGLTAFMNPLVVGGRVVGSWKRTVKAKAVTLEVIPNRPLTGDEKRSLRSAANRYAAFVGMPVTITEP